MKVPPGNFGVEPGLVRDAIVLAVLVTGASRPDWLTMHAPADVPHRIEFRCIEHFAEILKLIGFLGLIILTLLTGFLGFLLLEHTLESREFGALRDQLAYVDLCAQVIPQIASVVKQRRNHDEVHERRSISATLELSVGDATGGVERNRTNSEPTLYGSDRRRQHRRVSERYRDLCANLGGTDNCGPSHG